MNIWSKVFECHARCVCPDGRRTCGPSKSLYKFSSKLLYWLIPKRNQIKIWINTFVDFILQPQNIFFPGLLLVQLLPNIPSILTSFTLHNESGRCPQHDASTFMSYCIQDGFKMIWRFPSYDTFRPKKTTKKQFSSSGLHKEARFMKGGILALWSFSRATIGLWSA